MIKVLMKAFLTRLLSSRIDKLATVIDCYEHASGINTVFQLCYGSDSEGEVQQRCQYQPNT